MWSAVCHSRQKQKTCLCITDRPREFQIYADLQHVPERTSQESPSFCSWHREGDCGFGNLCSSFQAAKSQSRLPIHESRPAACRPWVIWDVRLWITELRSRTEEECRHDSQEEYMFHSKCISVVSCDRSPESSTSHPPHQAPGPKTSDVSFNYSNPYLNTLLKVAVTSSHVWIATSDKACCGRAV